MQNQRGFTLIETLVAITILMIVIVVPFYSIQQSLMASNVARDQLIASSLAQEGIEYVYYVRDTNYLYYYHNSNTYPTASGWLSGLDSCISAAGCVVDPAQSTALGCSSQNGCPVLYLNPASHLYTQTSSGNTPTRFTRKVTITQINGYEVRATVTVSWITAQRTYTITDNENLYNWL